MYQDRGCCGASPSRNRGEQKGCGVGIFDLIDERPFNGGATQSLGCNPSPPTYPEKPVHPQELPLGLRRVLEDLAKKLPTAQVSDGGPELRHPAPQELHLPREHSRRPATAPLVVSLPGGHRQLRRRRPSELARRRRGLVPPAEFYEVTPSMSSLESLLSKLPPVVPPPEMPVLVQKPSPGVMKVERVAKEECGHRSGILEVDGECSSSVPYHVQVSKADEGF
ncbi:hypothetical protein BHM03_00038332 [Ensete ventricosum]|nr:hypothetical protein BHM03_00038332 [Ensete ventricosum]